jgi:hypothetical protein
MNRFIMTVALVTVSLAGADAALSAVIGNWSGSGRSWNQGEFTTIKALMTTEGHMVLPDLPISAPNLAGVDMYIVGEATAAPSPAEMSVLSDFVQDGGCLLVFTNSSFSGGPGGNAILTGIGSSMSFASGFDNAVGPFSAGNFASEGPPYNLVGQNLGVSPGNHVSGGTTLYGFGLHYEGIGSGHVYAFGDRYDHDVFSPSTSNTNGQLFLNIAHNCGVIPEPASISLAGMALLVCGLLATGRQRPPVH